MGAWAKADLLKIAEADDLHIAPFREDGVTYGTPTWIWSVAVGDAPYVRAYSGQESRWYQAAVRQVVPSRMDKKWTNRQSRRFAILLSCCWSWWS